MIAFVARTSLASGSAKRCGGSFFASRKNEPVVNLDTAEGMGDYVYDDVGFRIRRNARQQVNGQTRYYRLEYPSKYFAIEKQTDLTGTTVPNTEFAVNNIYINGLRVAAVVPGGAARYFLTDQVDSVRVVTDDNGAAVTRFEYLPYGESWFTAGEDSFNPKYNSQELDQETNLFYFNARHYDPEIARFVTADSVVDGEYSIFGWNRYMYVHGNPVRYSDPTGNEVRNTTGFLDQPKANKGKTPDLVFGTPEFNNFAYPGYAKQLRDNFKEPVYNDEGEIVENAISEVKIGKKTIKFKFTKNFDKWNRENLYFYKSKNAINQTKDIVLGSITMVAYQSNVTSLEIEGLTRPDYLWNSNGELRPAPGPSHTNGFGIDILSATYETGVGAQASKFRFKKGPKATMPANIPAGWYERFMKNLQNQKEMGRINIIDPWLKKYGVSNLNTLPRNPRSSGNDKAHWNHLHFGASGELKPLYKVIP